MCILCENAALELLTAPRERLEPGQLAEAVRTAREAAGPGVLDHAESVLRGEAEPRLDLGLFLDIVVSRAVEAGVLDDADAAAWADRIRRERASPDPRVLAFVSSCAELIDEYHVLHAERSQIVQRFVEDRSGAVRFGWLGRDGELWFEYRGEVLAALTEAEAIEIVERELSASLHTLEPDVLIQYTTLPDTGLEVLAGILAKPSEVADSLLAGIIDLGALADDRVRSYGYAPFFQGDQPRSVEDARFGEWVIVRMPEAE